MQEFNLTKTIMSLYNFAKEHNIDICVNILADHKFVPIVAIIATKGEFHVRHSVHIDELERIKHPDAAMYLLEQMLNDFKIMEDDANRGEKDGEDYE